jgi:hypothetical protein
VNLRPGAAAEPKPDDVAGPLVVWRVVIVRLAILLTSRPIQLIANCFVNRLAE